GEGPLHLQTAEMAAVKPVEDVAPTVVDEVPFAVQEALRLRREQAESREKLSERPTAILGTSADEASAAISSILGRGRRNRLRVAAAAAAVLVAGAGWALLHRPAPRTVKVDSDPPGAEVLRGGDSLGRTPLRLQFPPGSPPATLQLRKDGY